MHAGLHVENSILHAVGYLSSKVVDSYRMFHYYLDSENFISKNL